MKKFTAIILILAMVLCGCEYGVSFEDSPQPSSGASTSDRATLPTEAPVVSEDPQEVSEDVLMVHFIDVGQADCALIEWGSYYILIDGGNKEDGSLVVSYLEQQGIEQLSAVICTHAHEDHVGGLPSVLAVYPTEAVYAPTRTYSSNIFDDFLYYVDQQGLEITIPAPGDVLSYTSGGEELTLTVVGPTQSYAETNDTSIVVLMEYGDTRFLFTGDMETSAENDMLDYWGDSFDWDIDVLKVGHHGSNTSSSYRLIYTCDPEYGIMSVGAGNSYGHPHEEILSRYADAGVTVFRTDALGTVMAVSDGEEVSFTWSNQNAEPENVEAADVTYIGNVNSGKFHTGDCSSLPKEENRIYFDSYEEAAEAGYAPCSSCLK